MSNELNAERISEADNGRKPMTRFQMIIATLLALFVVQTLVISVSIFAFVNGLQQNDSDVVRVQNMVLPQSSQYTYRTFFDIASGGTATWRMFDADRGFPVIEVRGQIAEPLRSEVGSALRQRGLVQESELENYEFRVQFLPNYETPENLLTTFLPSLARSEITRNWRSGFITFSAVDGGTRFVDVREVLLDAIFEVF